MSRRKWTPSNDASQVRTNSVLPEGASTAASSPGPSVTEVAKTLPRLADRDLSLGLFRSQLKWEPKNDEVEFKRRLRRIFSTS